MFCAYLYLQLFVRSSSLNGNDVVICVSLQYKSGKILDVVIHYQTLVDNDNYYEQNHNKYHYQMGNILIGYFDDIFVT